MAQAEAEYPGWRRKLTSPNGAIKVFCQVADL
jgi:hypothetical protein